MPYSIELLELSYSRTISPPNFEMANSIAALLRKLYETVSPEFVIRLSDMQALPATSMSDIGVKAKLFDGSLDLQITSERVLVTAKALRNSNDLKVVRRCVELAHASLASVFSGIGLGEAGLTTHGWLKAGGQSDPSATTILSAMKPSKSFSALGSETFVHPARIRIRNAAEQYACELTCDETYVPNSQLYFNLALTVNAGSPHSAVGQIVDLAEGLVKRWFEFLGVPTVDREGA